MNHLNWAHKSPSGVRGYVTLLQKTQNLVLREERLLQQLPSHSKSGFLVITTMYVKCSAESQALGYTF